MPEFANNLTTALRALTVRSPWAQQIMRGEKVLEYRSTPTRVRGLLLIHEAKPVGAVLGTVVLSDCQGIEGDYQWHLSDPLPLAVPIRCVGQLGFWRPPALVLSTIPRLAELLAAHPPHIVPKPVTAPAAKGRAPGWHCHCDHCGYREVPLAERAMRARCPRCGKWSFIDTWED
jgi:hypothetical protein